jgi:ABC-type transport system involved in multi-copper enzyme maturation permease subunit
LWIIGIIVFTISLLVIWAVYDITSPAACHYAKMGRIIFGFTPVSHFIKIMRMIMLYGSGFSDIPTELGYILTFALLLNG